VFAYLLELVGMALVGMAPGMCFVQVGRLERCSIFPVWVTGESTLRQMMKVPTEPGLSRTRA